MINVQLEPEVVAAHVGAALFDSDPARTALLDGYEAVRPLSGAERYHGEA